MSAENKEFYDLLNSIANEQTFMMDLSPRETDPMTVSTLALERVSCKQLTTLQLKKLIETVVDSPLTQSSFNLTVTKIFKDSLVTKTSLQLNVIDRLLFILQTRINSLSPTTTVKEGDKEIVINFKEVSENLLRQLKENQNLFRQSSATEGKITVTFGVALIDAETQLNEELYKNLNPDVDNPDELRKVLGDAFINEIAKSIQTLTIEDKTLDLSTVTFKSRLKAVESLPASLIQTVIKYIEKYKKVVDDCLIVDDHAITIDGSLFSLY